MSGREFELDLDGHDSIVTASGELDMACADALRTVLGALDGCVIVDLSAVTFVDSTVLGVLVAQRKRVQAVGGDLVIRNPHDFTRRALELTGLGDWIVA
jgi:anti-sigma B factor antagonist